jgi:hypothetical protein
MNRAGKVIALSIALIGGLWVYSYASPGDAQTYVSRSGSIDFALEGPSSFSLAQHHEDSIRVHTLDSLKLKDPNMALLYAVIPGVLIHGSGHFYAGKTKTGAVLLGSELVGGTFFSIGVVGKGMSQLEGGEPWKYGNVFMAFGGFLFFGSWIYDIIGAPLAVQRENREFLQGRNVRLRFDLDGASHSVRVQMVKRF